MTRKASSYAKRSRAKAQGAKRAVKHLPKAETIRDLIAFLHLQGTPAKSIDHFVCAIDVAKHADRALLLVRLESLEQMLYMCQDADHVICVPTDRKSYGGALFTDISKFPIARFYHVQQEGDLLAIGRMYGILKERFTEVKIPRPEALSEWCQENGWQARLASHLEWRKARTQDYEKIRLGRCNNTTTNSTFFLNSTGCLVCDGPPEFIASATFATLGGDASLIAIRLCSGHMAEAREDSSLVNYLARTFTIPFLIDTLKRMPEEVLSDARDIMQSRLGMTVIENGSKDVKARTAKGTSLIYRYSGELNYGYMINGTGNEELARIDSANHHRVEVGPDHLHPDLRNKLPPVSSFTTGDLCLDWPFIRQLIDHWEARLGL